jgi:glyoxylase-like metal-dependent hydrolase (beta-lactamase superfamily II)
MEIVKVAENVTALVTPVPVPGLGVLPVNAFVIKTQEGAILVDTCVTQPSGEFLAGVGGVVDPADIGWIWLTHPDRDHTGGLLEMLAAAPNARLVANFTSIGHILVGPEPVPLDRVQLVNDGDRVRLGDFEVQAFRPPLYDNPGTVGFFEPASRILVSSDCFGAPQPTMEDAVVPDVAALPDEQVVAGQLMWGSADSPWVHSIDKGKFAQSLDAVRRFDPALVLSTHIPSIHGEIGRHLDTLAKLPDSPPAVGPDQSVLEAMLAEMEPA